MVLSRGPIIRTLEIANAAIGVVAVVALIFSLTAQQDELASARHQSREIQAQRIETIARSCEEQNRRHDHTTARLDQIVPAGRRRDLTQLLINELAPKQDCVAVVRQATTPPPHARVPPLDQTYPPVFKRRR